MKGPTIALYRPQIPPNTGNISRLCVAVNSPLIIVGKPAFEINNKEVKRAGLDHWDYLNLTQQRFKDFYLMNQKNRVITITKEGATPYWDFNFKDTDILLFGNEQKGLPPKLLSLYPISIRIPMVGPVRSLNLANSVSIITYEFLRQMNTENKWSEIPNNIYERTFYKRK